MNLRKDHYRFARTCPQGRAQRVALGMPRGFSSPRFPLRRGFAGVFFPRGARPFPSLWGGGPAARQTSLVWTASRPDGGLPFPHTPPPGLTAPRQARLAPRSCRGGAPDVEAEGVRGAAQTPSGAPGPARHSEPLTVSAARRPSSWPPSARPRVPNSPPSYGGRRGVQCLPPRSPCGSGAERPAGPVISL